MNSGCERPGERRSARCVRDGTLIDKSVGDMDAAGATENDDGVHARLFISGEDEMRCTEWIGTQIAGAVADGTRKPTLFGN